MQGASNSNLETVTWNTGVNLVDRDRPDYFASLADIDAFSSDGVVLLRGVFGEWVEPLRNGLQRNLDNPKRFAFPCESNPDGLPGRFFDSYCNWQLIGEYLDFISNSCAASMAGQFIGSAYVQFFHEHAFCKAPGTQRATPWHQDLPYYCVDGIQTATIYVSLDQANADVAVNFVRGSHRWGRLFEPVVFEDGSLLNTPDPNLETIPDIAGHPDDYDIVAWDLEPGDAIVFDFRTIHGTGPTRIESIRRAFSTRWLGEDVKFCERPGETSPPYVDHEMSHGDKMREDWFPILWRE